jgi:hypothetical protein
MRTMEGLYLLLALPLVGLELTVLWLAALAGLLD